jgi:glutaredoxin
MLPYQVARHIQALGVVLILVGLLVALAQKQPSQSESLAKKKVSPPHILLGLGVAALFVSLLYTMYVRVPCEVVVYTMRGCPHCVTAKASLDERGVAYTEKEYVSGEGEPPQMPDGERASMFPTIWVNGVNMGSGDGIARWAGSCLSK